MRQPPSRTLASRALAALAALSVSLAAPAPARACELEDGSLAALLGSEAPLVSALGAPRGAELGWCADPGASFWELVEERGCGLPHVTHALDEAGAEALDIVAATFADPRPDARRRAAWALRELATPPASARWTPPVDPSFLLAVEQGLGDELVDVRRLAASAAWRLGEDAAPLAPALRRALRDADPGMRVEAAQALGGAGRGDPDTLAALWEALADPQPRVARAAALALTAWGEATAAALAARAEAGGDGVRAAVAWALGR